MDQVQIAPLIKARPSIEIWGVRIVALLTAIMGVVNLFSAIIPAVHSRMVIIRDIFPMEVLHGTRLAAALAGFALLLLAGSLWRRKRTAWLLTVLILVGSIAMNLVKGLDYEEASLDALLIVFLVILRPSYHADSDRPSVRQGLVVLAWAFGFTLAYGTIGLDLLDRHFKIHFGFWGALQQTMVMFTTFNNPSLLPVTGFGRYFVFSIYLVGAATGSYALLKLISPVLVRQPATADERARAARIVAAYGRTSLARPALFEDKSYFFSPGGSVIAYAARGRGVIALGDPIGPPADCLEAIRTFRYFCTCNDWSPAFVSVLPDQLDSYRAADFDTLCMGREAIVDLESFSLAGSAFKNARNAVAKMNRLGYRAEMHQPPLEEKLLHELRSISDEWLTMMRGGEMHFTVGWFDHDYIRNSPVMAVHAPTGEVTAFANLVPEYQKNETSLDLMRRRRTVENGTMELLFTSMLEWAKSQGYASFSLGQAPLTGIGEHNDDPRVEQALRRLSEYFNRFINFRGLHTFKEKFNPRWEPRYVVYPGVASLPGIITTLLRVNSDGNFLWNYLKK
ncbi:MAG: phosphatidylglycerol lysyltransferase domain-containing protein [Anaerolineales bacterium]